MPSPVAFNVEDYFQDFASKSALQEAERFKTIPTGSYKAQVTKREGRYFELKEMNGRKFWSAVFSDDSTPKPEWRKGVQLTVELFNESDKKIGTQRVEASWEDKRDEKTGKLDQLFNRWVQLKQAMFPNMAKDEEKAIGEVFSALEQFPFKLFVTESYKVVAIDNSTKWTTANNDEEAKVYREAGYDVRNFVQRASKL